MSASMPAMPRYGRNQSTDSVSMALAFTLPPFPHRVRLPVTDSRGCSPILSALSLHRSYIPGMHENPRAGIVFMILLFTLVILIFATMLLCLPCLSKLHAWWASTGRGPERMLRESKSLDQVGPDRLPDISFIYLTIALLQVLLHFT